MKYKWLKNYGYSIYLGIALAAFADLHLIDWQFYTISIPLIILVVWSKK